MIDPKQEIVNNVIPNTEPTSPEPGIQAAPNGDPSTLVDTAPPPVAAGVPADAVSPETQAPDATTPDVTAPDAQEGLIKELEDKLKHYEETNGKLYDLFDGEPKLLEVIQDMAQDGKSFRSAIASVFTPEEMSAQEGDDDYPDVQTAHTKRKEHAEGKKKKAQEVSDNAELSAKAIDEFANENGLSEEESKKVLDPIFEAVGNILDGKIDKKFLNSMFKALNYEKDISEASATGEIKGKNAKIVATKQEKKDDGLPSLSGGNDTPPVEKEAPSKIDQILESVKAKRKL